MAEKAEECKCIAAVRVRGTISAQREARATLDMLHLSRTNHAVVVDNRPATMGMLKRAQSYITWGEISKEALTMLLTKRGRLEGDKKLTDEYAQKVGCKSISDLADALVNCKMEYWKLADVEAGFRLLPPSQ